MTREEAIELLRGGELGIKEWNRRRARKEPIPDLSNAPLHEAELQRADLSDVILAKADLTKTKLQNA
ncbi:MAG: pentapeptide repeat-containing protein, partial [bacterium]|nr:pentapeptide repeat-containing protein [bacterium]